LIVNQLDLGATSNPWVKPVAGQVRGEVMVEGAEEVPYPRGAVFREIDTELWVRTWQGVGGQAAGSFGAAKYFLKQIEQLAANPALNPAYIQWSATADPSGFNASDPHDGWWVIDDFRPDYESFIPSGYVKCHIKASFVAAGPPREQSISYLGGPLTSNFNGVGAKNLITLPRGSTALEAGFNRVGAEGNIPCILSPAASPEPVLLSAAPSDFFKGVVHVYDTINTGTNPVPTSAGTFINVNWVEVLGTDHAFAGDCVITNGLVLLLFQANTAHVATCYLWSTGLASAAWQQVATLDSQDNAGNAATLRSYSLKRVGPFETAVDLLGSTGGGNAMLPRIRLQAGRYDIRSDYRPRTQASTTNLSLLLTLVATPKIIYNSLNAADVVMSDGSPAPGTDYGYGAAFITNAADPFIVGWLYQNQSGGSQPFDAGNVAAVGLGDTTSLAINAQRAYGFFFVPYGVNGSYSPANLQQLATAATAVGTTSTVADGSSSSGTVVRVQGNQPASGVSTSESGTGQASGDSYTPSIRSRCSLANASARVSLAGATGAGTIVGATYRWAQLAALLLSTGASVRQFLLAEEIYLTTVASPFSGYAFGLPVHYYRLGEASGSTATDTMGNGNGTYVASPTLGATGIPQNTDKAATFNGTTQYVGSIPITGLNTGASVVFSVECWVNSSVTTGRSAISYGDANVANGSIWMGIDATGHPTLTCGSASATSGTAISTATWYHLVGTGDGSNMRLYVNGSLVAGPTAYTSAIPTTASTGTVGARYNNGHDAFFSGTIDEAAFYAYALTAAQVTAHYNAGFNATYLYLDELALLPALRPSVGNSGPQDVFQQWLYDRSQTLEVA